MITLKFGKNISIYNEDILQVYLFNNKRINEYCYETIQKYLSLSARIV